VDGTLEITKRQVTLTSATDSKVYDGTALTNDTVTVTGDGWADGEGATYEVTGSQTDVGASDNEFTYALNDGTLEDNYDITVVKGQLTVTKPLIPTPTELQITGLKKLAGRTLKEGEFTFIVRNEADPDSMIDSDTNDEHGNFQLDILFKKEGTYKLVIEELKGSLPNVIYDSNSYLLTVEVEEDNNGVLHIVDSNLADLDVIFNNTYDPPTLPETGERDFNLFLYGGLSLIGSGLLLVRKKRKFAR
ncbi:MAG: FctA domain-containing protein, partial [Bacillota bacterium]|nr:FctA domain-containing protein [Bacillota bacterium]